MARHFVVDRDNCLSVIDSFDDDATFPAASTRRSLNKLDEPLDQRRSIFMRES